MAMAGTVNSQTLRRGYGFTGRTMAGDVFVHVTAVERAGLKSLSEGQRLSCDVEPDKKGKGQRPSTWSSRVEWERDFGFRRAKSRARDS
jgi:CspA family cold shock protein